MSVYQDIPFQLTKDSNTDIKLLLYEKAVQQSVKNIILTNRGELHYYPQFGSGIRKYLFEKFTVFTYLGIKDEIRFALENFEPRISDIQIEIDKDEDRNFLEVSLKYRINSIDIMSSQQITIGTI